MEKEAKPLGSIKQVICGIAIILITSWVVYVTAKTAGIDIRVSVLETVASTIKEDIVEIKVLMKEIRDDQRRRNVAERQDK